MTSISKLCIFIRFLFILIFSFFSLLLFLFSSCCSLLSTAHPAVIVDRKRSRHCRRAEMILRELQVCAGWFFFSKGYKKKKKKQQNPLVANYANESDAFNSALQRHSQVTSKVTAALLSLLLNRL